MKISYYGHKYAPESLTIEINNKKYEPSNTNIKTLICCGNLKEAIPLLKREYRQTQNKNKFITFCFFAENSKDYYFCRQLVANNNNLMDKLRIYKELKHHLQENPPRYTVESGKLIPGATEAPEKKIINVNIDFKKCKKIAFIWIVFSKSRQEYRYTII